MSWTVEIESSVSASRMFDAAILDWHNLGPKIVPEVLVSGTNEGNVRQLNFTSVMPFSHLKERMDFVDHETFECDSTITEGSHLGSRLESVSINYKIVEATIGDGCVIKVVSTTKPLPGIKLDDEAVGAIDKAKEAVVKHFKTVEDYLLANPDKYCVPLAEESSALVSNDDNNEEDDANDDILTSAADGNHPRDFYGVQVNGVYGGSVTIGVPKATKPKPKPRPVKPTKKPVARKPTQWGGVYVTNN